MPLSAKQKAKLVKKDPNFLGIYLFMRKFEEEQMARIKKLETEFGKQLELMRKDVLDTLAKIKKIQKGDRGNQGIQGPPGQSITGPQGPKGEKGKDGRDGKDGKNSIIPGPPGPSGKDGSPDTPEQILAKLIKVKIPINIIEGLENQLRVLRRNIADFKSRKMQIGGGGGGDIMHAEDLTSQCDGSTKTFTVPAHRKAIAVLGTQFPIIYRPTTDWTASGITLTLTSEVGAPKTGQTLIFIYIT